MTGGYMGKLVYVDLSTGDVAQEPLETSLCRRFVGGYGIGAKILYDRMNPGADRLGPGNILGFMTGPLTGTLAPIGSRYQVFAKSPLTNTWGDSNSGGHFGPRMKFAGVDGLLALGISDTPVYILVSDGDVGIHDAAHLWGRDCYATDTALRAELGDDVRVACIGPAGERLSLISCIMTDKGRAAGRSGLGAVMGSKRVKAIAVRGSTRVPVNDEQLLRDTRRELLRAKVPGAWDSYTQYGTCGAVAFSTISGDAPVKNWAGTSRVHFSSQRAQKISDEAVVAYQETNWGCWGCPVRCGGIVKLNQGEFALSEEYGHRAHKPEYETIAMFGPNLLNDDMESIIRLSSICDRNGLDTISTGAVIAFATECYENGLITEDDTEGIDLTWGNAEAAVVLAEKLAHRKGFGAILADGVDAAAERIGRGADRYAMSVNGQEIPAHDPKFLPGIGTTYVADATPARHTQFVGEDWWPPGWQEAIPDKYQYRGKGEVQKKQACFVHFLNATGSCLLAAFVLRYAPALPTLVQAVTGWNLSLEDCLQIGERIANLRHAFNLRAGHNLLDRRIPGRVIGDPPAEEGPLKGIAVDLDIQLRDYLDAMGWDTKTAMPDPRRLRQLGLEYISADLAASR